METKNESLQVIPSKELTPTVRTATTFDISNAEDTTYLATDLARFIREKALFHNIQGKEFVNVEGWQYAGTRLGILPRVEELTRMLATDKEGKEIKYQARVILVNIRDGSIVGSGFSICSNTEPSKKGYQEYAIASMAQTRAIGKAYRNVLAWIIKAAGYEPTPAEEMDFVKEETAESKKLTALIALSKAENRPALIGVYQSYKEQYETDIDFVRLLKNMAEKFLKPETATA